MDHLQRLFAGAVAEQVRRMENALSGLRGGRPGAEETLRRLAHAVRGSGASCGYPRVSELAAVAEQAPAGELASAVEMLLSEMRRMGAESRHRILLVDDDPLIGRLLEMRLAAPDREVQVAGSLAEARAALTEHLPDLVVLDLFLPDGDGRRLLADLRAASSTASLPVIVISAATGSSTKLECETLGADGFVSKPFDPESLSALVSTALSRPPLPAQPPHRESLMSAYRQLLSAGRAITVTAVVPETHGPGGRRSEGPDPKVAGVVQEAIRSSLPAEAAVGKWASSEPAVVAPSSIDVTAALDRARLRLRNHPHPLIPGAIVSLSAATVPDDGAGGLVDTYARARQFALDANRSGGDRVVAPSAPRLARRVLLAEDDTLTAALIINRLEQEGFEVEHHPDGVSALEAAERSSFGLVVVDIDLPGLGGLEVIQRLRSVGSLEEVPIVVVAAMGSERDVARGFAAGADDYILRPFSADELTARLRRFTQP